MTELTITKEEITKIQNIINKDKEEKLGIEGRRQGDYDFVKKEFGLSTLDEIEDELDRMDEEIEKITKEINEKGEALKSAYDWGL